MFYRLTCFWDRNLDVIGVVTHGVRANNIHDNPNTQEQHLPYVVPSSHHDTTASVSTWAKFWSIQKLHTITLLIARGTEWLDFSHFSEMAWNSSWDCQALPLLPKMYPFSLWWTTWGFVQRIPTRYLILQMTGKLKRTLPIDLGGCSVFACGLSLL